MKMYSDIMTGVFQRVEKMKLMGQSMTNLYVTT